MKKHIISAWILSALVLSSALASCSDPANTDAVTEADPNQNDTAAVSVDTAELTELEKRMQTPDNLPEKDWEGREFRILISDLFDSQNEILVEEQNGEQCNDAIYTRNEKIESRFNVKIAMNLITNADDHSVTKQIGRAHV